MWFAVFDCWDTDISSLPLFIIISSTIPVIPSPSTSCLLSSFPSLILSILNKICFLEDLEKGDNYFKGFKEKIKYWTLSLKKKFKNFTPSFWYFLPKHLSISSVDSFPFHTLLLFFISIIFINHCYVTLFKFLV